MPMRHGLTFGELTQLAEHAYARSAAKSSSCRCLAGGARCCLPKRAAPGFVPRPTCRGWKACSCIPAASCWKGRISPRDAERRRPLKSSARRLSIRAGSMDALAGFTLPGIALRPMRFMPTFDKFPGANCGGVYVHVTDPAAVRPYRTAVAIIAAIARLWPEHFQWLPPPYEYETRKAAHRHHLRQRPLARGDRLRLLPQ